MNHVIGSGGAMRKVRHRLCAPWYVRAWRAVAFRVALYRINRRFPGCATGRPPF